MAQIDAQTAQTQTATFQVEGVNEVVGNLLAAQQGMVQTVTALAQAAAGMNAPKTIEIVRDEQGRAAGAVVAPV